ncbi:MAG TPA: restriction endonuclease [Dokdonella sp.]|uniref:restriction endonuclease n=1 Tax=Dokdonella sp. TaxID=2291710 RepID=UPI002B9CEC0B|nr:restriction endonuclease [Dokdonella sp.]HUD41041.1 restriction endonuclease [Dokdonella sp.]
MGYRRNRRHWDDALAQVDPTRFEALLAAYYRGAGYRVEHVGADATGRRYDGGIDLRLYRDATCRLVQCKRWNAFQVPHNAVHELLGLVLTEGADDAILVTSGEFTAAAIEAARKSGRIELVDGVAVRAMLGLPEAPAERAAAVPRLAAETGYRPRTRPRASPAAPLWALLRALLVLTAGVAIVVALARSITGSAQWRVASIDAGAATRSAPAPAATSAAATSTSTSTSTSTEPRPQQAGQPLDPLALIGHRAAAQLAAAAGRPDIAAQHVDAMASDVLRSARVPDARRPIDRESARAAARGVDGVRSAVWLDRTHLAVMVDGAAHRSETTIDRVCVALEPLGDTLAVVVHVQDVTARHADGAATLSRNCQLAAGQRAAFERERQVDVVPEPTRKQFKAMQQR